jgi:DNA-binding transcriptional regulator YiaG
MAGQDDPRRGSRKRASRKKLTVHYPKHLFNPEDTLNAVERDLVEGLEGFLADLKSGEAIEKKYTIRRVVLDLEPHAYTAEQVKSVRKLLNASQSVFAQFIGVTVKAVRKWEGGGTPNDMACRFMDEIGRNPNYWRMRLKESIMVQATQPRQPSQEGRRAITTKRSPARIAKIR